MDNPSKLLTLIPPQLKKALFDSYKEIAINYIERRWEPSELNGGKFCEVVYTIADGHLNGNFPNQPQKPKNMVAACRNLENIPPNSKLNGDRSFRILIPRVIQSIYEIRNNRGVGHIGGDVNPNFIDATAVYGMSSWVLAEIIRIFHSTSIKRAQEIINVIAERKYPIVWETGGIKRVLNPKINKTDQTLLLLYSSPSWVSEENLLTWVEYTNTTLFKNRILKPLHKMRLIEYDELKRQAKISPVGSKKVEEKITDLNV